MKKILLSDLLDMTLLEKMKEQKYIREQVHPLLPLRILNYTEHAQFDRMWNDATRLCRGLVYDYSTFEVVARPFSKFFNHGEPDAPLLDPDASAHVSDKMDGSLGILYPLGDDPRVVHPGAFSVATRGSFMSEQAQRATMILRERYPYYRPQDGITTLVEIVYPGNRIVLDYGKTEDLFLLGGVDIASGTVFDPDLMPNWPGPVTEVLSAVTLAEALALPVRENREGVVVRQPHGMVKIKQADYIALHRILTMTSARNIWEYLAVNACKDLTGKKWGTQLGLDPKRAEGILAAGPDWQEKMLSGVPDEFFDWFRITIDALEHRVEVLRTEVTAVFKNLSGEHEGDRKGFALEAQGYSHAGLLFQLLDGRDITPNLWKAVYPEAEKPWGQRSEDVS